MYFLFFFLVYNAQQSVISNNDKVVLYLCNMGRDMNLEGCDYVHTIGKRKAIAANEGYFVISELEKSQDECRTTSKSAIIHDSDQSHFLDVLHKQIDNNIRYNKDFKAIPIELKNLRKEGALFVQCVTFGPYMGKDLMHFRYSSIILLFVKDFISKTDIAVIDSSYEFVHVCSHVSLFCMFKHKTKMQLCVIIS